MKIIAIWEFFKILGIDDRYYNIQLYFMSASMNIQVIITIIGTFFKFNFYILKVILLQAYQY